MQLKPCPVPSIKGFPVCLHIYILELLQKHAYSNILKISPSKNCMFSDKNSDSFHISAQNIDCRYSLEPLRWAEISRIR